jgi:hypothetical protein
VLLEAAQNSEAAMARQLREMSAGAVPGDTYRNLEIRPVYSSKTFKHILVPVWLLTYTYANRPWQVIINGYTGRIAGEYPKSPWKIALLVLVAIIVAGLIVLMSQE